MIINGKVTAVAEKMIVKEPTQSNPNKKKT